MPDVRFAGEPPWIVRWPGWVSAGTTDKENFISSVDFPPTVLDVLNLPPMHGMDGRSFLSVLRGKDQPDRDIVFTMFERVRMAKWRTPDELYDVACDPHALQNLVAVPAYGQVLENLRSRLLKIMESAVVGLAPATQ